ncbi:MAG TPA: hypothetical protein VMZ90_03420 [Vicinamibacterales bacterium]|nr:hypothetical protein [Vicinamibacterales bacterium]
MRQDRVFLALALSTLALPSAADDAALRRCRALKEASARLACYDAVPLQAPGGPALPQAAAQPAPSAAPQPAAPASPAETPEARFGMERRVAAAELPTIESYIPGPFQGWGPNYRIRLANGQVWQIADDSGRRMDVRDPKVTVRRGALGAFFLDFEGDNRSPRVKRIQ